MPHSGKLTQTRQQICCLCEAMCGLDVAITGDSIVSIRGNPRDRFSRGHLCPKALGLEDLYLDPDRLRAPQQRQGETWQALDWNQALDLAADRLTAIRRRYGPDAIGIYTGNPFAHNYGAMLFAPLLNASLGTRNRYSSSSLDQLPYMLAALEMLGHQLLLPVPDLERTDFLLILGANPLVSNGSAMSAPDFRRRLKQLHQRGGQSILLDPRRTESAAHVSEHRFIRPGTDALLLLAMLQVIHAESLARPGRLADFCDGFDRLDQLVRDWPPERVSAATGIASEAIRELARRFASAPTAVCYGRMGTCTQAFGSLSSWLINVLNIVTGNFDRPGGAMFARPAVDLVRAAALSGQKGSFGRWHSRVRGLPEFGGELPAATLADEIETPGSGQIKALITLAGNPVLSAPNGRRLEALLPGLDFMLAIDIFRNETTRHADLILPPVSPLERSHFDLFYPLLAVDNYARFAPPLYAPPVSARHDWQILLALSTRLEARRSLAQACFARLRAGLLERLGPEGMIDMMLRTGPYPGLSLSKLRAAPDGLALGPLSPCLPGRLHTPRRRIRLVPARFAADLDRLAAWLAQPLPEFVLIGRRQLRSNNSWLHNSPRLVKGPDPCTLLMHPDDAGRLGLKPGDHVRLGSRSGEIDAPLELSASMMPGVVSLPHGWGHHRPGLGLTVAAAHAGVSANDLTDELWLDQLSGTAAFNGVPVRIEKTSE